MSELANCPFKIIGKKFCTNLYIYAYAFCFDGAVWCSVYIYFTIHQTTRDGEHDFFYRMSARIGTSTKNATLEKMHRTLKSTLFSTCQDEKGKTCKILHISCIYTQIKLNPIGPVHVFMWHFWYKLQFVRTPCSFTLNLRKTSTNKFRRKESLL